MTTFSSMVSSPSHWYYVVDRFISIFWVGVLEKLLLMNAIGLHLDVPHELRWRLWCCVVTHVKIWGLHITSSNSQQDLQLRKKRSKETEVGNIGTPRSEMDELKEMNRRQQVFNIQLLPQIGDGNNLYFSMVLTKAPSDCVAMRHGSKNRDKH